MLHSRSVRRAALIEHLKNALTVEGNHFFADTSFLISAASLNPTARDDLARWIDSLGPRFHIPAWVAHELYGKITSGVDLFAPMSKVADQAIVAIEALQTEAHRYVDDERSKDIRGRPDRVSYLASLDRLARPLLEQARIMRQAKQTVEECTDWVVELVNKAVLPSNIYGGLPHLDADYAARVVGGLPPGFMDKGKAERTRHGDNRYGDLIIWREVLDYARLTEVAGVVLLTNDNKQDWVYVPPTILDENGRTLNNEARKTFKIILPLPLLVHELSNARPGAGLTIANLGMLSQLLHEIRGDAENLFSAYQPVVTASSAGREAQQMEDDDSISQSLGEAQRSPEMPAEGKRDLAALLKALVGRDVDAASEAIADLRDILVGGFDLGLVQATAQNLLAAAENDLEAAAILVREITTAKLQLDKDARLALLRAMIEALYYDDRAKLRNRPLEEPLEDVFAIQTLPEMRESVATLNERLGPSRRYFLLTPEPTAPTLTLSLTTSRDEKGMLRLKGIYFEELSLLEDVPRDNVRSLARMVGGVTVADGAALRRVLSRYFRVPEGQLDIGVSRFETVGWHDLTGLIDWGVNTGLQLR